MEGKGLIKKRENEPVKSDKVARQPNSVN